MIYFFKVLFDIVYETIKSVCPGKTKQNNVIHYLFLEKYIC